MIEIDGSQGEGGGQVLRTSLALAILTRQPIHLYNLRAGRKKPGLQPQHLKSVEAAAAISAAETHGAALNSRELFFNPGAVQPGRYHFEIGTAGSTSLVLQTVFLPLSLAGGTSHLTITGGTHVPHSPCYHYLEGQWLPFVRRAGLDITLEMEQAGFYPRGGGRLQAVVRPAQGLIPLQIISRGALQRLTGLSGVANLDSEIARRQKHQALRRLEPRFRETKIRTLELPSPGKGTFLSLLAEFERSQCLYFGLGELGKRAERVADEAVDALEAFLATDGAVDQFLADQLLLLLALANGTSRFRTSQVTTHLLTNAQIIRLFLPVEIEIEGELGQAGEVRVTPAL
jgi:RNA 3'-terminal phosphate cyclase (ATP)